MPGLSEDQAFLNWDKLELDSLPIIWVLAPIAISGYRAKPVLPWVMEVYPDIRTPGRKRFSYTLRKFRMFVECAFG